MRILQGSASLAESGLGGVAFIPVFHNSRLAAPNQTFLRLRRPLHPFAFELSPTYAQYINVLGSLGVREEPAAHNFKQIYLVKA